MVKVIVYKVYDEDFTFYGDKDDIMEWLLDSQKEYIMENLMEEDNIKFTDDEDENMKIVELELERKGWEWGLENAGTKFEEIYSKELK